MGAYSIFGCSYLAEGAVPWTVCRVCITFPRDLPCWWCAMDIIRHLHAQKSKRMLDVARRCQGPEWARLDTLRTWITPVEGTAFHICRSIASIEAIAAALSGEGTLSKLACEKEHWPHFYVHICKLIHRGTLEAGAKACNGLSGIFLHPFARRPSSHLFLGMLTRSACLRMWSTILKPFKSFTRRELGILLSARAKSLQPWEN